MQSMQGRLLFLGTGASAGVPLIGCDCDVCRSHSPFNKRLRSSVLIKIANKQFLIDAGPDFREQALRYHIKTLDGLILTHAHYDHIAGLDELRIYCYRTGQPLPTLLSEETAEDIQKRFDYIFQPQKSQDKIKKIDLQILPNLEGELTFEGIPLTYMTYEQGGMKVNGFKFGNLAYLSDIRIYPSSIFNHLKDVKTLIVSALRRSVNDLHFSVDEAVSFIQQAGVERAWLTHISHDLDYEFTNANLPSNIRLAYDGLEIDFG